MDPDVLRRLLAALETRGVSYAVFGAGAMMIHGLPRFTQDLPRFTQDLDVFVAPDADNILRLKQALRDVVDDPAVEQISADDLLGEYPAVQYTPPDQSYSIDILTRLGEAYAFADLTVGRQPFAGLTVSVVSPRTLYEMKKNTVRPKDRIDALALRARYGWDD
jgi:hypothetical protein